MKRKNWILTCVFLSCALLFVLCGCERESVARGEDTHAPLAQQAQYVVDKTGLYLDPSVAVHRRLMERLELCEITSFQSSYEESYGYNREQIDKIHINYLTTSNEDAPMRRTIFAIYDTTEQEGVYQVVVQYEWLKKPGFRKNENITIESNRLELFSFQEPPHLVLGGGSKECGVVWQETLYKDAQTRSVNGEGASCTFDLPAQPIRKDKGEPVYIVQLWVKAKVPDEANHRQVLSVSASYQHTAIVSRETTAYLAWDYNREFME